MKALSLTTFMTTFIAVFLSMPPHVAQGTAPLPKNYTSSPTAAPENIVAEQTNIRFFFLKQPPVFGNLVSPFGYRKHPIANETRLHQGIDIQAKQGTPVHAVGDGVVIFSGRKGGFGKLTIVSHGNGITTYYAHLARIKAPIDTVVSAGDILGTVGQTGSATGPHLHFELRADNLPISPPLAYLLSAGIGPAFWQAPQIAF